MKTVLIVTSLYLYFYQTVIALKSPLLLSKFGYQVFSFETFSRDFRTIHFLRPLLD